MKKYFILLVFVCIGLQIQAQYKTGAAQFTVWTGGSVSWVHTDAEVLTPGSIKPSFDAGLHFDYYFRPHFAFSTGIGWGYSWVDFELLKIADFSFQSGPRTLAAGDHITYRMQLIEIPLGLKMSSREIGYTTLFADYGILPMIFVDPTAKTSDGITLHEPAIKEIRKFDLGYQVHLGFKYSFGNKTCLVLSAFYKNTFLDFTTDYLSKPHDNSRINQAGIRLGFGF